MNKDQWGVHSTHCCSIHGCKYREEECPVVLKQIGGVQCEDCCNNLIDRKEFSNSAEGIKLRNKLRMLATRINDEWRDEEYYESQADKLFEEILDVFIGKRH